MPTNQTNFEILAIAIITSQYPFKTIFSVNMNSKFDDKKIQNILGEKQAKMFWLIGQALSSKCIWQERK